MTGLFVGVVTLRPSCFYVGGEIMVDAGLKVPWPSDRCYMLREKD